MFYLRTVLVHIAGEMAKLFLVSYHEKSGQGGGGVKGCGVAEEHMSSMLVIALGWIFQNFIERSPKRQC